MAKSIKETKEVLDLALGLIKMGQAAKADGKVDASDLSLVFGLLPLVAPAIAGASDVLPELKDLDAAEASELVAHVMGKLAIDSPKATLVVEKSLKAAIAAFELVRALS